MSTMIVMMVHENMFKVPFYSKIIMLLDTHMEYYQIRIQFQRNIDDTFEKTNEV